MEAPNWENIVILRLRLIFSYLLAEMIPTLIIGLITFISVLLMFQMLRLTDYLLQHDVGLRTLLHLLSYMSISFLPALLPMSLIFAVILAYNRLSADSEVIAFKSLGLSMWPLLAPALALGVFVATFSAYTTFRVGPWGNRQYELLITEISNSKIISAIQEGTFSGFFDLVVYTNKINRLTDELENVFIYDERDKKNPTTIISEKGQIMSEKSFDSYKAFVRLINGDIHKMTKDGHTKINFKTYDLQITEPTAKSTRDKSMESLTYEDLTQLLRTEQDSQKLRNYQFEWHKRFSLSFACVLFALLGVGLGCKTNVRAGKSGGGLLSVAVIVIYWLLFVVGNNLSKSPDFPLVLGAWLPSIILLPASFYFLKKNWN